MSDSSNVSTHARVVSVGPERAGQRLDNFLLGELKGVPRSLVYRVLRTGQVRVNKGRAKAGYRLEAGDQVRIPPVRTATRDEPGRPPEHQLRQLEDAILYEDERLIVVDKPAGMAVHGGSGVSFGVIEVLRALRSGESDLELVHRLDRDTSGCLLVTKRRSLLRWLHGLIRENGIDKRYTALLAGRLPEATLEVNRPLRKNTLKSGERVVRVDPEGKPSRTWFRRIREYPGATLVEARLHTGRTHQIRVHAADLGAPVAGDEKYGDREANRRLREAGLKRLFLHASALTFPLPDSPRPFRVEAPLGAELEEFLEHLRVTK